MGKIGHSHKQGCPRSSRKVGRAGGEGMRQEVHWEFKASLNYESLSLKETHTHTREWARITSVTN